MASRTVVINVVSKTGGAKAGIGGLNKQMKSLDGASGDFQFAAAAACFGMLLRDSEHKGESTYDLVLELARSGKGDDPHGYRGEFVKLVELAKSIRGRRR